MSDWETWAEREARIKAECEKAEKDTTKKVTGSWKKGRRKTMKERKTKKQRGEKERKGTHTIWNQPSSTTRIGLELEQVQVEVTDTGMRMERRTGTETL